MIGRLESERLEVFIHVLLRKRSQVGRCVARPEGNRRSTHHDRPLAAQAFVYVKPLSAIYSAHNVQYEWVLGCEAAGRYARGTGEAVPPGEREKQGGKEK